MKLSKEKYIRSAVANEEQNIGGILYRFPGKSIDGVKDQMLRRDKEVKKLYNVFNQMADSENVKEKQLIGKVIFKIKYLGYPAIWLHLQEWLGL